ncbi:MAG: DNA-processing protein DprA [Phycisphaeraceae bacterium]|nr:DNA-processing protein DprA [Phycisphaeraceae bacterium]
MPRGPGEVSEPLLRVMVAPGVGSRTAMVLRSVLGSWEAVVRASRSEIAAALADEPRLAGMAAAVHAGLLKADPDRERAAMERVGAGVVQMDDPDYPALLRLIPDPPPGLFVRGRLDNGDAWSLAVVGSRAATAYGIDSAGRLACELADRGLVIVSGGARGIDAAAHQAALRVGGRTIAVMGGGLARPYPAEHERLFDRMLEGDGALISEFPMEMEARPGHFPRRNRIIAGLALGVLVIEAAVESGANITARLAVDDLGRMVMAVPGPVGSRVSAGCHRLIRSGSAALVVSAEEVLEDLRSTLPLMRAALDAMPNAAASGHSTVPEIRTNDPAPRWRSAARRVSAGGTAREVERRCAQSGVSPEEALAALTLEALRSDGARDGATGPVNCAAVSALPLPPSPTLEAPRHPESPPSPQSSDQVQPTA